MDSLDETLVLKWNNHGSTFAARLSDLRYEEACADVTITCEGAIFPAHKFVLSTCSDYLSRILALHPNKHQVLFFSNVPKLVMEDLLDFMYNGNISIPESRLSSLLKVAEELQIKGLVAAKQLHSANYRPNKTIKRKIDDSAGNKAKRPFYQKVQLSTSTPKTLNGSKDLTSPNKRKIVSVGVADSLKKKPSPTTKVEKNSSLNKSENKIAVDDSFFQNSLITNIKQEDQDLISSKDDSSDRSMSPTLFSALNEDIKEDHMSSYIQNELVESEKITAANKSKGSMDDAKKENHCEMCNKSFTVKSNLQRHIDTHHKNIKYTCEVCDKTFTRKDRLKVHQKVHSNSYNLLETLGLLEDENEPSNDEDMEAFVCQICNKRFDNSKNLRNHLKVHDDTAYPCDECGTVFKHLKNLKRHKKNHHMSTSINSV